MGEEEQFSLRTGSDEFAKALAGLGAGALAQLKGAGISDAPEAPRGTSNEDGPTYSIQEINPDELAEAARVLSFTPPSGEEIEREHLETARRGMLAMIEAMIDLLPQGSSEERRQLETLRERAQDKSINPDALRMMLASISSAITSISATSSQLLTPQQRMERLLGDYEKNAKEIDDEFKKLWPHMSDQEKEQYEEARRKQAAAIATLRDPNSTPEQRTQAIKDLEENGTIISGIAQGVADRNPDDKEVQEANKKVQEDERENSNNLKEMEKKSQLKSQDTSTTLESFSKSKFAPQVSSPKSVNGIDEATSLNNLPNPASSNKNQNGISV